MSRSFATQALSRTATFKTKQSTISTQNTFTFLQLFLPIWSLALKIRWAPLNFAKSPPPPSHPELLLLNKTPPGCQRSWCSVELTPLVTPWPDWARPPSLPPLLKHWLWHQKDRGTSVLRKAGNEKSWWGKDEGKGKRLDVSVLVVCLLLVLVHVHVHLVQCHHFLWSFSLSTSPVVCAQLWSSLYVLHLKIEFWRPQSFVWSMAS